MQEINPSPLTSIPFRWLLGGTTIQSLGAGIAPVALAFAVLDLGGSAQELGLVIALYAAADVITSLFGGWLGDRIPRSRLVALATAGNGLIQLIAAVGLIGDWATIPLLGVLGAAGGCATALAVPSSRALIGQTIEDGQLSGAVASRRLGQNVGLILGTGLAGMLVVWIGSGWALAVDAAALGVAAWCFSRLRAERPTGARDESMLRGLAGGAREVFRHAWLWLLLLQALIYHLFFGGAQAVLGPIVIGETLGREAWGWGLAAMMVGFVTGGLVSLRWRPQRPLLAGVALLILTAAFPIAMAYATPTAAGLAVLLAGAFAHGFGLEIFSVGWDLSIQQNIAEDKLARVYALDQVGSFVARPVGLALTAPVAALTGFRPWLVVVGVVIVASCLAALAVPSVRRLRRRTSPSEVTEARL
ncbi:MFS transporter [Microlunatus sp. GCM10028923]|uniref:MFS transporter n=1 Tax=Microlunatus sp. GCM10028923 TaxID=3273400 RepID=UPI00361ADDE3